MGKGVAPQHGHFPPLTNHSGEHPTDTRLPPYPTPTPTHGLPQSALEADPRCFEALDLLFRSQSLSTEEERALIDSLSLSDEDSWLRGVYRCRARKAADAADDFASAVLPQLAAGVRVTDTETDTTDIQADTVVSLRGNADVETAVAELLYERGDAAGAYEATQGVLSRDPFHLGCIPTHVAAALALKKRNELFKRGHQLVEEYPNRAVSWFAVGSYYHCAGQHDAARRHFSKATQLEEGFLPAWLGFGHSFAAREESDQAMAAYRTASRLFPGNHLPLLCIGVEYSRTSNLQLAEQFLRQAAKLCPADPLVSNELGVLAYRQRDFGGAEAHFQTALALAPQPLAEAWEARVCLTLLMIWIGLDWIVFDCI